VLELFVVGCLMCGVFGVVGDVLFVYGSCFFIVCFYEVLI